MGQCCMRQISRPALQLCYGTKVLKGSDEVYEGSLPGIAFCFVCHGSRLCRKMEANQCHTKEDGIKPFIIDGNNPLLIVAHEVGLSSLARPRCCCSCCQ